MSNKVFETLEKWGVKNYKVIDKQAIKEITLGASILATGGGGDPEIGLLWAYKVLDEGKTIVMVDPMDIPDDILVASPACLGAPVVLTEKPPSADVLNNAIRKLEQYWGKKLQATIPIECGGVNSTVAYAAAGEFEVPVIDVDGMNRAFPELQMTSWVTNGVNASPTVSCDDRGNVTVIDTGDDNKMAENIARRVAMAYGGISWIATYPMTGKQVKEASILNSQSIAWELGKAVYRAREKHLDPVEEMLKSLKATRNVTGVRVFKGKIVDISREFGGEATKGFSLGRIKMEGLDDYKGSVAEIDFQNEWLVLRIDGRIRCLPPDLIAIVDSETGEPIRTDIMKYGYRGSIILIPAHERMRTPKGIELFGPRYFGYDIDYVPVEELNKEVWQDGV
ncbi:hypothetical protein SAMN05660826_02207 [Caldanaerovirga acetigignens]|uniref:DUF917 domain-containing protein n=1 Tax=Caldanaerovirga acetigignens TaxID=447595 RepID=A0A1M7M868_9FIRM|nr:DUF917 domain-containing protein [Caldanaerovirga acetigignens]SHM86871.1 hypothetical protein SAMN05660826_02207 [Caldanaerovirga acetigignens]